MKYLLKDLRNFNKFFRKDVNYNNIDKKQAFILSEKCIFGKTKWGWIQLIQPVCKHLLRKFLLMLKMHSEILI